jgi:hypothetical protein
MARVATYASEKVQVIVGTRALRGKSKGTFVKISRSEDSYKKKVGADGEVSRSSSADRSGRIEVTLDATSEDNAYLQQLANLDEDTKNGIVPSKVQDGSGSFVALAAQSWIVKPADNELGDEVKERTWIIECAELVMTGGGN